MSTPVIRRFRTLIQKHIDKSGQHLIAVFDAGPGNHVPFPFVYTIGNHAKGWPELLILCPGNGWLDNMGQILNRTHWLVKERGAPYQSGDIFKLHPASTCPLKVREVGAYAKAEYCVQAGQWWQTQDYRLQQLLIPDTAGKFPDEEGCMEEWARIPVLGRE